jgi:hypothetical protein
MAILANHGIAEAKGTRNTLQQGPAVQFRRQSRPCGLVTHVCGEELVLVDEDFH